MAGLRILVTGATGHIGSVFCPLATARGHAVTALHRRSAFPKWADFDCVVNLAAAGVKPTGRTWATCLTGNFLFLQSLLNSILVSGAKPRIVLAQSVREFETATNLAKWDDPYTVSKKLGSLFAQDWERQYKGTVWSVVIAPCYQPGEVEAVAERLLKACHEG